MRKKKKALYRPEGIGKEVRNYSQARKTTKTLLWNMTYSPQAALLTLSTSGFQAQMQKFGWLAFDFFNLLKTSRTTGILTSTKAGIGIGRPEA
jgi:hypothetical protein